jgi:hypothetical protein
VLTRNITINSIPGVKSLAPHPLHPFSLRRRGRGLRWLD